MDLFLSFLSPPSDTDLYKLCVRDFYECSKSSSHWTVLLKSGCYASCCWLKSTTYASLCQAFSVIFKYSHKLSVIYKIYYYFQNILPIIFQPANTPTDTPVRTHQAQPQAYRYPSVWHRSGYWAITVCPLHFPPQKTIAIFLILWYDFKNKNYSERCG
jgi:hypothetical protein